MNPPEGFNSKHFNNSDTQDIRKAVITVSYCHQELNLNVPQEKKISVKNALAKLVANEWDTDTYGTWLKVFGIINIKNALLKLKNENFISKDFYASITTNFPIPDKGSINLLEESYPEESIYSLTLFRPVTQLRLMAVNSNSHTLFNH